ncbi:hypothetical protein ACFU99_37685, partial [Streptomyces sp. NPDC057654]
LRMAERKPESPQERPQELPQEPVATSGRAAYEALANEARQKAEALSGAAGEAPAAEGASASGDRRGYRPPTVEDAPEEPAGRMERPVSDGHTSDEAREHEAAGSGTGEPEAAPVAAQTHADETASDFGGQQEQGQEQGQGQERGQEQGQGQAQGPSPVQTETAVALDDMRTSAARRDEAYRRFDAFLGTRPDLAGLTGPADKVREWFADASMGQGQNTGLDELTGQIGDQVEAAQQERFAHELAQKAFEEYVEPVTWSGPSFRGQWFSESPRAQELEDEFMAAAVPRVAEAGTRQEAGNDGRLDAENGPLGEVVTDFRTRFEQAYQDWSADHAAKSAFESATRLYGDDGASNIALGTVRGDYQAINWYRRQVGRMEQDFVEGWNAAGQDTAEARQPAAEQTAHDDAHAHAQAQPQAQAPGRAHDGVQGQERDEQDQAANDAAQRVQGERDRLGQDLRRNALDLMAQARTGGHFDQRLKRIADSASPDGWHPEAISWYKKERQALLEEFTEGLRGMGPRAWDGLSADFEQQLAALRQAGRDRDLAYQDFAALAESTAAGTVAELPGTHKWMADRTDELRDAYVAARQAEKAAEQAEAWRSQDTTGRRPELVPAPSHIGADDWRNAAWQDEQVRIYGTYDAEMEQAAKDFGDEQASAEAIAAQDGVVGQTAPQEGPFALSDEQRLAFNAAYRAWAAGPEGQRVPEGLRDQVRRRTLDDRAREAFTGADDAQDVPGRLADTFTREGVRQMVLDRARQTVDAVLGDAQEALDKISAPDRGQHLADAFLREGVRQKALGRARGGADDALTASGRHGEGRDPAFEAAAAHVRPLLEERLSSAVEQTLPVGPGLRDNLRDTLDLGARKWSQTLGWAKQALAARVAYEQAREHVEQRLRDIAEQPQEHLDAHAHAQFAAFEAEAREGAAAGPGAVGRPRFDASGLRLAPESWDSLRAEARSTLDEAYRGVFDDISVGDSARTQTRRLGAWYEQADTVLGGLPERVAHQAIREHLVHDAMERSGEALESWQEQHGGNAVSSPRLGDLTGASVTPGVRDSVRAGLTRDALGLYGDHFEDAEFGTGGRGGRMRAFHEALRVLTGQEQLSARILRESTWQVAREQGQRVFSDALAGWQEAHPSRVLTADEIARAREGHEERVRAAFDSVIGQGLFPPG